MEKGEKDFREGNLSPADEVMKRIDEEVKKRFENERRKTEWVGTKRNTCK